MQLERGRCIGGGTLPLMVDEKGCCAEGRDDGQRGGVGPLRNRS